MARAQTYSNYKSHNTVKILVGITPQGNISFASNAWGGRTSDMFLTDNCGILKKLLPGDLVMADRNFYYPGKPDIARSWTYNSSIYERKVPVGPSRCRGSLWHCKCPNTRGRIIIGLLWRKYTILSGILPIDFLQCDPNGSQEAKIPMIDGIITICAALTNLSIGIVSLDWIIIPIMGFVRAVFTWVWKVICVYFGVALTMLCDVCWLGVCCDGCDCWLGVCCVVCDCWIGACCCLHGCGLTWCTTHGLLRLCDKADWTEPRFAVIWHPFPAKTWQMEKLPISSSPIYSNILSCVPSSKYLRQDTNSPKFVQFR